MKEKKPIKISLTQALLIIAIIVIIIMFFCILSLLNKNTDKINTQTENVSSELIEQKDEINNETTNEIKGEITVTSMPTPTPTDKATEKSVSENEKVEPKEDIKNRIIGSWHIKTVIDSEGNDIGLSSSVLGTGIRMSNRIEFRSNGALGYYIGITPTSKDGEYKVEGNIVKLGIPTDTNTLNWETSLVYSYENGEDTLKETTFDSYTLVFKKGEFKNNEQKTETSQIDWEEYPDDIDTKSQNLMKNYSLLLESLKDEKNSRIHKSIYSILKNTKDGEKFLERSIYWDFIINDSVKLIKIESPYLKELRALKSTDKINYKIAVFDETPYGECLPDGGNNVDIDSIAKYQYDYFKRQTDYNGNNIQGKEFYYKIDKLMIMNGNNTNKTDYMNYSRPKKIKVTINKKKEYTFELKDTNKAQVFDIDYKQDTIKNAVDIDVELLETYKGKISNDIYISDLQFSIYSDIPTGR